MFRLFCIVEVEFVQGSKESSEMLLELFLQFLRLFFYVNEIDFYIVKVACEFYLYFCTECREQKHQCSFTNIKFRDMMRRFNSERCYLEGHFCFEISFLCALFFIACNLTCRRTYLLTVHITKLPCVQVDYNCSEGAEIPTNAKRFSSEAIKN